MKKKILSLICSFIMIFASVSSLAGCSLVKTDNEKDNNQVVVSIDGVDLTRSDVVSAFYNYYQNNSSYFAYYDGAAIEESFYTWAIMTEVIRQKSIYALYDAEKNPNGYTIYSQKEEDEVWKSVYSYVYNQINSYETAIYKQAGYTEDEYPVWLKKDDAEDAATGFEAYSKYSPEKNTKTKADAVAKSTEEQIKAKLSDVKTYIREYVVETDKDGNEQRESISQAILDYKESDAFESDKKAKYIETARDDAYAKYVEGLVTNAKLDGKPTAENEVLANELVRIYDAYYKSQINTLFQKYCLDQYLFNEDINGDGVGDGDSLTFTEKYVVQSYLENYYADVQSYQNETSYIATVTSKDGASLVLYNYNGKYYYFTVQHILVGYDTYMKGEIAKLPGYSADGKVDVEEAQAEVYLEARQKLTDSYAMLTEIKEDNIKDSLVIKGDYYYYDSKLKGNKDKNYGYIKVLKATEDEAEAHDVEYYIDNGNNIFDVDYDTVVDTSEYDVKYYASEDQILDSYNETYTDWAATSKSYFEAVQANNKTQINNIKTENPDLAYVFESIDTIWADTSIAADKKLIEINKKVASFVFVELQWVYSSDSLDNKISNKMGYVISNEPDNNGSWVSDFAIGSRNLLAEIESVGIDEIIKNGDVTLLTTTQISNYGYHIIKVEDVYTPGSSLIDISDLDVDLSSDTFINKLADRLRNTFVCSASNQTVYNYVYDELYENLVGTAWVDPDRAQADDAVSGTYYVKLQYEWLSKLYDTDKIEFKNKIGYDKLMDLINV